MNRNQLADALVKSNVDTTELHVANMRGNYSKSKLIKKLSNLNYATNYRLNRYSLKKNSKFPRVAFYCFNEYAFNNTFGQLGRWIDSIPRTIVDRCGKKFDI